MHETQRCFFNLEALPADARLPAGRNQLRGWLVGKPETHFTDVRARIGENSYPGVHGFPRGDLAAHFDPARAWLPAEFVIDIDVPAAPVDVILEAQDLAGSWEPFHTLIISGKGTLGSPPRLADPVTAIEFGRALQLTRTLHTPIAPPWPRVIRENHPPFHGYLARPEAIAPAKYGRLEVLGWLFHQHQSIAQVFASTDLITFQPLNFGGAFEGVAERHPGEPRAADCRFEGAVEVSSCAGGAANVRIFAVLTDGSVHLCLATRCRPMLTEELKLAWPPFSPWQFLQQWTRLRATLAQRRIPLQGGPDLRREFWRRMKQSRLLASPVHTKSRRQPPAAPPPTPLRLLLLTHNLNFEGAPLLMVEYAEHLIRHGRATVTVLAAQNGPLKGAFEEMGASVRIHTIDISVIVTRRALACQIARLAESIDWPEVDLVVANTVASYWGVLLADRVRRPSLLYIHESTPPHTFPGLPPPLIPAVAQAFRRATAVSFNTPATRAYYEHLGAGPNYHLNPGWVDVRRIDSFRAAHPREQLRAQCGLTADNLLVANVGTICERKGQHDFVRAVEWLWQCDPVLAGRCRFVMVGGRENGYNASLRQRIAALGRSNLQIIPETSHAYDYFGAADLFVCTSYEESFPRVVMEAMAFSVPIVSTHVHGIPYQLRNGGEATLVAPGDIAALASAIRRSLAAPAEAAAQAARARTRVAEFDAANVLPRHADFTARIASQSA